MKRSIGFLWTLVVVAMSVGLVACGGGESPVAPVAPTPEPRGNATIQGFVSADGVTSSATGDAVALDSSSIKVSVVGTSLATMAEEDGFFQLAGIQAGSATLKFSGPGVDATLTVSGLVDGQVLTVHVQCTTTKAEVVDPPKEITFSGEVKSISSEGTWLKVDTREVTTSKRTTLDKGGVSIKPSEVSVGWKVQVTGTVGKKNVVSATCIIVVTTTGGTTDPDEINGTLNLKHLDGSGNPDYIVVDGQTILTNGDTQTGGSTYWKEWPSWNIIGHQQFNAGMAVKVMIETKNGQRVAKYVFKV